MAAPTAVDNSYSARTWLAEDGLPENRVVGVAQTSDGFLWVATQSGVVRFDGVRFRQLRLTGSPDLILGTMRLMMLDREGRIWIAREGGVIARLDGAEARTWTPDQGLPMKEVQRSMVMDGEGSVWVSYEFGKVMRISKNGNVTAFTVADGLPGGSGVCWLASGEDGRLWFAKGNAIGVFRNGRFEVLEYFGSSSPRIGAARSGGVWICTGSHLLKFNEGAKIDELGHIDPARALDLSSSEPTALFEDSTGTVWVGTASAGLYRCDHNAIVQVAIPNPDILSVAEDSIGNLWVGTRVGLNRVRRRVTSMIEPADGPPLGAVQSVCQDGAGALWAVVENGVLVRKHGTEWTVESPVDRSVRDWVTCVTADTEGAVWIGARGGAVYRWNNGRREDLGLRDRLHSMAVRSLLATSKGDLWIATDSPDLLFRLRGGLLTSFALPTGYRFFRAMAEDANGTVWAGASDGLLVRVSQDTVINQTTNIASAPIRCLHCSTNGDLWVGYAGAGIGRLRNGSLARFNTEQGLPNDSVSQILTDDRGRVWFAGNQGIFQIRERDFDDVAKGSIKRLSPIIYGRNEGMSGLQASFDFSPNAWRASDGRRMYFSMLSGLAEVMLDYSYPNQLPPAACIERVSADGQTVVEYQGGGVATNAAHAAQLELGTPGNKDSLRFPPGTHRVQFEFTAPNFVAPESVQFRYRLEGSGEKWVDAGSNRVASYSRPPPGCYRFRVIARNENGVWDEKGKDVPVIFEPYIWETHWFRLTAAAGILGVLFGVVTALLRLKHGRAIKKMQDLQYLALERARIARMMTLGQLGASIAHEVNQPLSAMIMDAYACLGWLEQDFPNLPEVRDALHRIMRDGKRGGDIVARIRAVLKNEPPFKEQVNINELIREIIIIVEPNLQGVAVELRLDKNLPSVFADRVQLQQVLLNLAVNAIHAMEQITNRPRVLHIRTTSQENHGVLVEIEDSGIGLSAEGISQVFKPFFTTKAGGMGLGLAISRSIVETHHGRLWATANQSSGATFHFTIDDFTQSYLPKIK